MKRVLTAVVLVPLVLLIVFRAPLWLFVITVAAITVVTLREYLSIVEASGIRPFRSVTYIAALLPFSLFCAYLVADSQVAGRRYAVYPLDRWLLETLLALFLLSPVIFGIPLVLRKELKAGLASSALSAFGLLYIAGSLSLLVSFRADAWYSALIIFVLFSVWAGDIAAYYVGSSIGKHKLAPVVSPNKSWEGATASVVASVLIAILVFHYYGQINGLFVHTGPLHQYWLFPIPLESEHLRHNAFLPFSWLQVIALGVLTNIAAQFGDLFESALKRGANLKDSGSLLPGHGGILDRIDALLFAVPVVWYYAHLTGLMWINLSK